MKTIKVYGVYDLMEWNAVIPCPNGIKLHVHFADGSASVNGTVPAKYRTDNAVIQALIESSEMFKRGRIKLVRTYKTAAAAVAAPKEEKVIPGVEKPAAEESIEEPATTLKQVKVSDIEGEGRRYLIDEVGVSYRLLNTVKAIKTQAAAHGIEFIVG